MIDWLIERWISFKDELSDLFNEPSKAEYLHRILMRTIKKYSNHYGYKSTKGEGGTEQKVFFSCDLVRIALRKCQYIKQTRYQQYITETYELHFQFKDGELIEGNEVWAKQMWNEVVTIINAQQEKNKIEDAREEARLEKEKLREIARSLRKRKI